MFAKVVNKLIGSANERVLKQLTPVVAQINALEAQLKDLNDEALKAKTPELQKRLLARIRELGGSLTTQGRIPPESLEGMDSTDEEAIKAERKRRLKLEARALEEILPEAFALVREAGRRFVSMRHFDVQLMGGMVLHQGKISEMATGEGKTLVATLAIYLNALLGRGVHLVTVNDYLAKRDRHWMGPIYEGLGLTVGVIQHDMPPAERRAAYASHITYGTNNEFGFDYLRDNMAISAEECVQRGLSFAIVDEVDSILIDEARTPLIISGPAEESTQLYYQIDRVIPKLTAGVHYQVDEKAHAAILTEEGIKKAEEILSVDNLYDDAHVTLLHHLSQALRAHTLFKRDVEYMIKDNQVIIVDEFTGRLMPGRRWSDGLHQAIEAKEGVKIERENQTLATITFQNYFRMYDKLAGMTGTASTEAPEFHQIYKLDVMTIPTNCSLIRTNYPDVVYKSEREKFAAVVEGITQLYQQGRPILVGTVSIQKSERVSDLLKRRQIPHHVLNAKYHEQEAQIVAQAGRYKAVTIATNMAGRGTDILLGGNADFLAASEIKRRQNDLEKEAASKAAGAAAPEVSLQEKSQIVKALREQVDQEHQKVVELGGLHVIGTERHESRRIDNQLRGRSGRQGDPGSSRFYISLEDDLIRIFGENRLLEWTKAAFPEGEALEHRWLTGAIETAQKRVEMQHFEARKRILEYDNVMNRQREVIYRERRAVLEGRDLREKILEMIDEVAVGLVNLYAPTTQDPEAWNFKGLWETIQSQFGVTAPLELLSKLMQGESPRVDREVLLEEIQEALHQAYQTREATLGSESMRRLERWVMLQLIDSKWKDHLYSMDHLREGIGYRVYGQQDPLVEYQHEAYQMFVRMVESVRSEVVDLIFKLQPVRTEQMVRVLNPTQFLHPDAPTAIQAAPPAPAASPGGAEALSGDPMARSVLKEIRATPIKRDHPKVGRNDPCPCGSNKKYKKCHGNE